MKKLGKKDRMQNGTLVAFSCDCISTCQSYAVCDCSSNPANWTNNNAASMGKIVASALSGGYFFG